MFATKTARLQGAIRNFHFDAAYARLSGKASALK
jgi:hypothetical protein